MSSPLPLNDAAKQLGISTRTFRRLVREKRISVIRYTERGKIYVEPAELDRFKNECSSVKREIRLPPKQRLQVNAQFIPRTEWGRG